MTDQNEYGGAHSQRIITPKLFDVTSTQESGLPRFCARHDGVVKNDPVVS